MTIGSSKPFNLSYFLISFKIDIKLINNIYVLDIQYDNVSIECNLLIFQHNI